MPWSFHRRYAATYDQAMTEIDAAVAELKAKGARRIVVIGHSLGANAAIGYAARRRGLPTLPVSSRCRRGICPKSATCAASSPTRSRAPKN